MKRLFPFLICLILSSAVHAQEVEFLPDDWENPAVFEKGQKLPRKCGNFQLLNGKWKFRWVKTPDQVPPDFWQPRFDTKE